MQLTFRPDFPPTRVQFARSALAVKSQLEKLQPWVLVDSGWPSAFTLKSRGQFSLPAGESGKRWAVLGSVLDWLAANHAERGQPLVVIGGGAALDVGALAASLYRRGMPLVLVPTTLLAMVDATLGGKTAVDREVAGKLAKNFAGTFYPAQSVVIFPPFLSTLPERERLSGAGECWKMLWLSGQARNAAPLLEFVRTGAVSSSLRLLIKLCLREKRKIVERDPLDRSREREKLNFGHTVGHALEALAGLSHGEAVLWGMLVESSLLGGRENKMQAICLATIQGLGLALPPALSERSEQDWLRLLKDDKKNRNGKIDLSLLRAPGRIVKKTISPSALVAAIKGFPESFQRGACNPRG